MRKIIVFILAVLYLGLSSGTTIHLHYCMGRLVSSSLVHDFSAFDKCNKCGMPKKDNGKSCCRDEHQKLKIEKDQNVITDNTQSIKLTQSALTSNFIKYDVLFNSSSLNKVYIGLYDPVKGLNIPIYLYNCVFRI